MVRNGIVAEAYREIDDARTGIRIAAPTGGWDKAAIARGVRPPPYRRARLMNVHRLVRLVPVCVLLILPAAASAQSSMTGVVRDTSGAVLPGVTVEAASPVLIDKVRSAVTDAQGLYRIVDLRPGAY